MVVGTVEFLVTATELVPPVPDAGAVIEVVIPGHIVLNLVTVMVTLVKLGRAVDTGVEVDGVEVDGVEVDGVEVDGVEVDGVEADEIEADEVRVDEVGVGEVGVDEAGVDAAAEEIDEDSGPVQKPFKHVLKAHCELDTQGAAAFPQTGICIELTA